MTLIGAAIGAVFALLHLLDEAADVDLLGWGLLAVCVGLLLDVVVPYARTRRTQ